MALPGIDTEPLEFKDEKLPTRLGTPIESGATINKDKLEKWEKHMKEKWEFYSAYPDLWVDELLIPENSSFKLLTTQRIFLRAMARHGTVHLTGARGISKTFTTFIFLIHQAIFKPNSVWGFAAPNKSQSAKIANQTYEDIINKFPILQLEMAKEKPLSGKDYFELEFRNGSKIFILAALDSSRGIRLDGLAIDEARDQDGGMVNAVLIPMLTKTRRTVGKGELNKYEKQQVRVFTTSASAKSNYNYEKVIDTTVLSIINPEDAMAIGLDYRVPVAEGIYPASFVRDMRNDSTNSEEDFAREFLSIYTTENSESWFNFKKINMHRRVVNAEWEAKPAKNVFYTIVTDVGRLNDQTIAHIMKNYVKYDTGKIHTKLINSFVLGKTSKAKHFKQQAIDLKRLIAAFDPQEVAIDTNGLGIGLADMMIEEQEDEYGNIYPAYAFFNDKEYDKIQSKTAPRILYSFKASAKINSEMFSNCYTRIDSGLVDFLIPETKAKSRLLSTKKGMKMTMEERVKVLMPYEMTKKLLEEMGNQRLRRIKGNTVTLEPINARFPDDRFSALCIGLYRIKMIEEEKMKRRRRRKGPGNKRSLVFYTGD